MQASIYRILPFDATKGTTITFSWSGNQIFKNRCIIKNNDTQATVYDSTITTFQASHTIPGGKLTNGTKYLCYITVYDKNGVQSDLQSMPQPFMCFATPTFKFTNITNDSVIDASTYGFELTYSQPTGELLNTWTINVYNHSKVLQTSSGPKYNSEHMSHTFSGFINNSQYYIRGIGETVNGMALDTGYISINAVFSSPKVYSLLHTDSEPSSGLIKISTNITAGDAEMKPLPASFVDNDFLYLKDNTAYYKEGFKFSGDFSFVVRAWDFTMNAPFLMWNSKNNTNYQVIPRIGKLGSLDTSLVFELRIASANLTSVIYSNKLFYEKIAKYSVCVSRINGFYNIKVLNSGHDQYHSETSMLSWALLGQAKLGKGK